MDRIVEFDSDILYGMRNQTYLPIIINLDDIAMVEPVRTTHISVHARITLKSGTTVLVPQEYPYVVKLLREARGGD